MTKTATVLRHIHFEDLGSFANVLADNGYAVRYRDVGDDDFLDFSTLADDLLVVLGGPIGVYEDAIYPFLTRERDLIAQRLAAQRPTLGICLGAQLIAAALESKVFPSGVKEIGLAALTLSEAGAGSVLRHLRGIPVLHWHGDTYELPTGAQNLASTPLVAQQAFQIGNHVLGLQFHAEVDPSVGFERWLVGHASELAGAGIDIVALREDARKAGPELVTASRTLLGEWLSGLDA